VHSGALACAQDGVQGSCYHAAGEWKDIVFLSILVLLEVMMNVVTVTIPIFTVPFSQPPRL
jgi:hypothetical protein